MKFLFPIFLTLFFGPYANAQASTLAEPIYTLVTGSFGYDATTKKSFPNRKSNGLSFTLFEGLDLEINPETYEKSLLLTAGDESFYLTCAREIDQAGKPTARKYGLCQLRMIVTGAAQDLNPNAKLIIKGHLAKALYQAVVKHGTVTYKTGATLVKMANIQCTKRMDAEKTTDCVIVGTKYISEPLDDVFKDVSRINRILQELGL